MSDEEEENPLGIVGTLVVSGGTVIGVAVGTQGVWLGVALLGIALLAVARKAWLGIDRQYDREITRIERNHRAWLRRRGL